MCGWKGAKMSRKDYKLIAGAIYNVRSGRVAGMEDEVMAIVEELKYQFARDNPRFNSNRFVDACLSGTDL